MDEYTDDRENTEQEDGVSKLGHEDDEVAPKANDLNVESGEPFDDFDDFGTGLEQTDDADEFDEFAEFTTGGIETIVEEEDEFGDLNGSTMIATTLEEKRKEPTKADILSNLLSSRASPSDITAHLSEVLSEIFPTLDSHSIPSAKGAGRPVPQKILATARSDDLWNKLSQHSVFYNPVTGAVGQLQWNRSRVHREYLRSLGVKVGMEDTFKSVSVLPNVIPQASTPTASLSTPNSPSQANKGGFAAARKNNATKVAKEPEEEMKIEKPEKELDIALVKAYCDLTEETFRIYPSSKLRSIVSELEVLARQMTVHLSYWLDAREQLLMDSETYNDLISCIVGHAQKIREHPKEPRGKDGRKLKKTTTSLNLGAFGGPKSQHQRGMTTGGGRTNGSRNTAAAVGGGDRRLSM